MRTESRMQDLACRTPDRRRSLVAAACSKRKEVAQPEPEQPKPADV